MYLHTYLLLKLHNTMQQHRHHMICIRLNKISAGLILTGNAPVEGLNGVLNSSYATAIRTDICSAHGQAGPAARFLLSYVCMHTCVIHVGFAKKVVCILPIRHKITHPWTDFQTSSSPQQKGYRSRVGRCWKDLFDSCVRKRVIWCSNHAGCGVTEL